MALASTSLNMLNKKLLMSAQQSVCAGLLGEGVKVVFDADVPCADLENRVMHLRPMPDKISNTDILHLRADCDHEMGHFGVTDPKIFDKIKNPLHKLFLNGIEDGFIERWVTERWFGCGENLRESNKKLYKEILKDADDTEQNRQRRAISALCLITFGHELEEVYKIVGPDVAEYVEQIEDLIDEMRAVENTNESLRLSELVAERWQWAKPTGEKPKPKKGKPKKGEGKGKAESKGEPDEDEDEKGKPEEGGDEKGKPATEKPKAEAEAEAEATAPEPKPKKSEKPKKPVPEEELPTAEDLAKTLSLDSLDDRRKRKVRETAFKKARYFARTDDDKIDLLKVTCAPEYTTAFVEGVRKVVPPLRRRLLMEFRGVGTRVEYDKRKGELDRESLHKVALGNSRIFTSEERHIVPDADVTLLIDASGSMICGTGVGCETRLYLASQAACAFSSVLDLIGVSNECLAFTTSQGDERGNRWMKKHRDYGGTYTRVRPLRHLIIKKADERFRAARHRFASLSQFDHCAENVDGESVMWAARRLAARNRPGMRPILMVFSDGEPASMPEHHGLLNWHLKETVLRIEKAGIHTIGIGIASTSVKRFFKNHLVLNDLSDLVGTSYRILREVLKART